MTQTIISLLKQACQANHADKFRKDNLVFLPADVELIAAGDIHGHQRNFEKIIKYADLDNHKNRHLMLQEIIHGGPEDSEGGCLSFKLLFNAIRYKLQFPDRVHFIMSNHDTTFINNGQVIKDGKEMNRSMRAAIDREFLEDSLSIQTAMADFFLSQPLAVKCENKIWLSHSLPADKYVDSFDVSIFSRKLKIEDTVLPGSAYLLTWGRRHSQQTLDRMVQLLRVELFILGHQRQVGGWSKKGENLLVIASDHNHGCLLPINIARTYTIEQLIDSVVPLASIA